VLSLILDDLGIYYDARCPSRLELILEEGNSDVGRAARASSGIDRLRTCRLSKYTPPVGPQDFAQDFVLVVDQTRRDASIPGANADEATFRTMLDAARAEHPGTPILVKSHPDVVAGAKQGHFHASDLDRDDTLITQPCNPWALIECARAVYTVSSQMGYEAVLAGKHVRCFGRAFYAGWGLTEDEQPMPQRTARPNREALFAACHLDYPVYYDPWHDRLCSFETALEIVHHQVRAATPDPDIDGEIFTGVRLWKRRSIASFRPAFRSRPEFVEASEGLRQTSARQVWMWASKAKAEDVETLRARGVRTGFVEDGFLRSVGLGAELTEAASLIFDRQGIYFDPTAPSDLEDLVVGATLGGADETRAARLRKAIVEARVTKYNVGTNIPIPDREGRDIILVPGQVEDDASILRGCGEVRSNLALLTAVRDANPEAWIIYKPHPDVVAGLRAGAVAQDRVAELANETASGVSAAALLDQVDAVWTMTSLMGFEALLRDKAVTCLGAPFYAGWGLTRDLGPPTPRRTARPSIDQLVWAALIAYPSYRDPVTGMACSPELIVERLGQRLPMRRAGLLSKLQGMFAGQSWLWR
jgi:capsular polysaccharide export protein